jgi:simple sugar transport system substrate-binding protein
MHEATDRIPCGEDSELAYARTMELITTYPELTGILGFGSLGPIGAAQAVKEKGLIGKLAVVGNVTPEMAAPYLEDGSLTEGYLWDPSDSGYASVFTAKHLLEGGAVDDIEIPGIGKPAIVNGVLAFDATLVITKDNALELGF